MNMPSHSEAFLIENQPSCTTIRRTIPAVTPIPVCFVLDGLPAHLGNAVHFLAEYIDAMRHPANTLDSNRSD